MSALQDGYGGYLLLILIGFLVHEPWRWLGLFLGRNLSTDSEIFHWVRAVATALVAGLVIRLILFPAGALVGVSLAMRLTAFAAAIIAFFLAKRSMGLGVAAGALCLMLGQTFKPF
jgi:branched-subunit amino acid transport protein